MDETRDRGGAGTARFRLLVLGLVLLTVVIRLPSLLHPRPIDDETVYSLVANEIVQGGLPYVDAVERKPPLLFWTYAAVFDLAGPYNWAALHLAALAWTLATMAGLYTLGRRLFDPYAGLAAAFLYSAFQAWGPWTDLAFNGEMLMNLPLAWAFATALHGRGLRPAAAFVAGTLVGAAFLLKQPAAIAGLPLVGWFAMQASPAGDIRRMALPLMLLAAGGLTPIALAAVILHAQGILAEAVYWTIGDHDLPHVFWGRAFIHSSGFVFACLPVLAAAVLAVRRESWSGRRGEMLVLAGWLGVSCIGVAAGGRFYPHYYIQLLPPLALLGAPALARAWQGGFAAPWPMGRIWIAVTLAAFATMHWIGLIPRRSPPAVAQYVQAHTRPGERIFVWGHMPEIYLAAQRRPAARYILTFPLTGYVFGPEIPGFDTRQRILWGAWAHLENDFAAHRPAFIVDTEVTPHARYPLTAFPRFKAAIDHGYRVAARFENATVYQRLPAAGEATR